MKPQLMTPTEAARFHGFRTYGWQWEKAKWMAPIVVRAFLAGVRFQKRRNGK